jgi:hypothetical protein
MANRFLQFAARLRSKVFPVAALALLLPLPGKCIVCSPKSPAGAAGCCASKAKAKAADRSCCARPSASHDALTDCGPSCWQVDANCACCEQPRDQNVPPTDRFAYFSDHVAATSRMLALNGLGHDSLLIDMRAAAPLPSLIPHRILHCSWQI